MAHDYDWLVIGSGFGGSVVRAAPAREGLLASACSSAAGGSPTTSCRRSTWDLRRYFWAPRLGMRGIFRLSIFKDVAIVERRRGRRRLARLREHALPRAPALLRGPAVGELADWEADARAALRRGRADARRRRLRRGRPRRRPAARVRARDRRRGHATPRRASACSSARARGRRCPTRTSAAPGRTARAACAAGAAWSAARTAPRTRCVKNYLWLAERAGARGAARARWWSTSSRSAPPTAPRATR